MHLVEWWRCGVAFVSYTWAHRMRLAYLYQRPRQFFLFSCCIFAFFNSRLSIFPIIARCTLETNEQVDSIYMKWLHVVTEARKKEVAARNPGERIILAKKRANKKKASRQGSWEHRKITIACRSFIPGSLVLCYRIAVAVAVAAAMNLVKAKCCQYTLRNFISNIIQWLACCCCCNAATHTQKIRNENTEIW